MKKPNLKPRERVLLVTFDLANTKAGDPRYRAADDAMSMHGLLFKPIKQTRFLLTSRPSQLIRQSIEQRTGRLTILIAPLTRAYQISVKGPKKREEMRRFLEAVRNAGLDTSDFDNF